MISWFQPVLPPVSVSPSTANDIRLVMDRPILLVLPFHLITFIVRLRWWRWRDLEDLPSANHSQVRRYKNNLGLVLPFRRYGALHSLDAFLRFRLQILLFAVNMLMTIDLGRYLPFWPRRTLVLSSAASRERNIGVPASSIRKANSWRTLHYRKPRGWVPLMLTGQLVQTYGIALGSGCYPVEPQTCPSVALTDRCGCWWMASVCSPPA